MHCITRASNDQFYYEQYNLRVTLFFSHIDRAPVLYFFLLLYCLSIPLLRRSPIVFSTWLCIVHNKSKPFKCKVIGKRRKRRFSYLDFFFDLRATERDAISRTEFTNLILYKWFIWLQTHLNRSCYFNPLLLILYST